jgi:hypothetical protein
LGRAKDLQQPRDVTIVLVSGRKLFHLSGDCEQEKKANGSGVLHAFDVIVPSSLLFLIRISPSHSFCFIHGAMSNKSTGPESIGPKPPVQNHKWHYPFWFGGSAASMAAVVTHPLDLGREVIYRYN